MRVPPRLVSIFLLALPIASSSASATTITRVSHGTVSVSFVNGISAGESFAATLVYDDAAPFSCGESFTCFYPAISLRVDFQNGASLFDNVVSMHVETNNPSSTNAVFTAGGAMTGFIRFEDTDGTALPGGANLLPDLSQLNSPAWDTRRLFYTSTTAQSLQGDITLVTPEPRSALLLVAGLLGLAGWRRAAA